METLEERVQPFSSHHTKSSESIYLFDATDFGELYGGATRAAAAAVAANFNVENNTHVYLDITTAPAYEPFIISKASRCFKLDLESKLEEMDESGIDKKEPLGSWIVVDPEKDRKNLVTEWSYKGRSVFVAAPDHGQLSALIHSATSGEKNKWAFHGAVEIDKSRIIPDEEIASETHQLWDGHAAYAPAATLATIRRSIENIGTPVSELRFYSPSALSCEADNSEIKLQTIRAADLFQIKQLRALDLPRNGRRAEPQEIVHYIGTKEDFDTFRKSYSRGNSIIHFSWYGDVRSKEEASAALYFAGVNIFQDTSAKHLIVYDPADSSRSLTVELTSKGKSNVNLLAVDDGSASSLFSIMLPKENPLIIENDLPYTDRKPVLDEQLGVISRGNFYEVPVFQADANGNIRLFANPYRDFDEEWEEVTSLDVLYGEHKLGTFPVRLNYSATTDSDEEVGVILNPAQASSLGSRRPQIELFVPSGSICRLLQEKYGIEPKAGDKVLVRCKYEKKD